MSEEEKMSLEDLGELRQDMERLDAELLKGRRINPNLYPCPPDPPRQKRFLPFQPAKIRQPPLPVRRPERPRRIQPGLILTCKREIRIRKSG